MSEREKFEFLILLLKSVIRARGGDSSQVDAEFRWPTAASPRVGEPTGAVAVSSMLTGSLET